MENKMEEVAKLLGVELREEFNIKGRNICICNNPYLLTDKGLIDSNGVFSCGTFTWLFRGDLTIEKIPFKPKHFETYYYVNVHGGIDDKCFDDESDYYRYNANNCFRTSEEITDEDKERIVKEMRGKYDEG